MDKLQFLVLIYLIGSYVLSADSLLGDMLVTFWSFICYIKQIKHNSICRTSVSCTTPCRKKDKLLTHGRRNFLDLGFCVLAISTFCGVTWRDLVGNSWNRVVQPSQSCRFQYCSLPSRVDFDIVTQRHRVCVCVCVCVVWHTHSNAPGSASRSGEY